MFGILFLLCLASGLLRLQDLVRSPPTSKMEVHIRQGTVNTYRQVLREIKQRDINNIIVDTRTEHVHTFFRAVSCSTHQTKRSAEKVRSFVILTTSFRRLNIKKKEGGNPFMEHYIFDYYTSRWRSKTHKSVKFPIRLWRHHKMGGGGLYIADDCNTNVRLFFCSPANLTRKKQKKKRRHKSVCNDICPPSLGLLEASFTSLLCACVCGGRGRSKNTSSYGCYQRPLFHDFFFPQFGGGFRHK